MNRGPNMTKDQACEIVAHLEYRNGDLYWKVRRQGRRLGAPIGHIREDGYRVVSFDGRNYYAHRLVWELHHGRKPLEIDHINGNRSDNRIENLRECDRSQNTANTPRPRLERSLPKGVYRDGKRFRARINKRGKTYELGSYETVSEASRAYLTKAEKLFGEFACQAPELVVECAAEVLK